MASTGSPEMATGLDGKVVDHWVGEYSYAARRGVVGVPAGCQFSLEIYPTWLGFFRGQVQDDAAARMSEPGKIFGWRSRRRIHFVKRMPVRTKRVVDPKTRQVGEPIRDEHRRHPMIFYSGAWVPESDEFRGRWRFLAPFRIPGTWFARRIG